MTIIFRFEGVHEVCHAPEGGDLKSMTVCDMIRDRWRGKNNETYFMLTARNSQIMLVIPVFYYRDSSCNM